MPKGRKFQQSIDLCELGIYLSHRKNERKTLEELMELALPKQQALVQTLVHEQVEPMLKALHESNLNTVIEKPTVEPTDYIQQGNDSSGFGSLALKSVDMGVDTSALAMNQLAVNRSIVTKTLGFCPSIEQSTVEHPSAGEGLFVRGGRIERGSVVAFYPGEVYIPYQLGKIISKRETSTKIEYDNLFGTDEHPNDHKLQRFDGIVINAKVVENDPEHKVLLKNPFAVGHKINHPPKGKMPNVMVCSYDFTSSIEDDVYASTSCNWYNQDPVLYQMMDPRQTVKMNSTVFIATSDIEDGAELFVNYRYNPNLPADQIPDWYSPIDEQQSARRWAEN